MYSMFCGYNLASEMTTVTQERNSAAFIIGPEYTGIHGDFDRVFRLLPLRMGRSCNRLPDVSDALAICTPVFDAGSEYKRTAVCEIHLRAV